MSSHRLLIGGVVALVVLLLATFGAYLIGERLQQGAKTQAKGEQKPTPAAKKEPAKTKSSTPSAPDPPSEDDAWQVYQNQLKKTGQDEKVEGMLMRNGLVKPQGLKKTNGQMMEQSGRKVYKLEFEVQFECLQDRKGGGPAKLLEKGCKRGEILTKPDSMLFEQTENGWKGEDGKVY